MGRHELRLIGIVGIVFVILLVPSAFLTPSPVDVDKPIGDITRSFTDHRDAWLLSTALSVLVLPFFLVFASGLRSVLARAEGERATLANAGYGAAIGLAVIAGLVQPIVSNVLAQRLAASGSEPVIRTMYEVQQQLYASLSVATAVFLLAASLLFLITAVMPRWLGALGILAAALSGVGGVAVLFKDTAPLGVLGFIGFIAFVLWILITSIVLIVRDARATTG